jgi:hypothetical protein
MASDVIEAAAWAEIGYGPDDGMDDGMDDGIGDCFMQQLLPQAKAVYITGRYTL